MNDDDAIKTQTYPLTARVDVLCLTGEEEQLTRLPGLLGSLWQGGKEIRRVRGVGRVRHCALRSARGSRQVVDTFDTWETVRALPEHAEKADRGMVRDESGQEAKRKRSDETEI